MGYLDAQLIFSDAQVVAANGNSTNLVDMVGKRNLGSGKPLYLNVEGTQTTNTADATLQAKLVGADDNAFTVNKITIADTGAVALPTQNLAVELQAGIRAHPKKEFYRVEYTIGGTAPSFTVTSTIKDVKQTSAEVVTV